MSEVVDAEPGLQRRLGERQDLIAALAQRQLQGERGVAEGDRRRRGEALELRRARAPGGRELIEWDGGPAISHDDTESRRPPVPDDYVDQGNGTT